MWKYFSGFREENQDKKTRIELETLGFGESEFIRIVREAELERLKIDVVNELHEIRRKHAGLLQRKIE